jgi:hypothetical protein
MLRHLTGTPANGCSGCGHDFTSTSLFDRHRVGVYAYTLEQGLKLDPTARGRPPLSGRGRDADEGLGAERPWPLGRPCTCPGISGCLR